MDEICSSHGADGKCIAYTFLAVKHEWRDYFGDLGVDVRITLNCILKK
jgi:hypothetical protein